MTHAAPSPHKDWWLRAALVLQAPRPVFTALRDETEEDTDARSEPVLAIVILAGVAAVLASPTAGHLLDDPNYDGLLIALWALVAGAMYGALIYWMGGLLLHFALRSLGSPAAYRRSRQILAFACVPLVLSLVLWAPRLALYGYDAFRYDGADEGTGNAVFGALTALFVLWSLGLLVVGVRAVERWTWARSLAAVAAASFLPALLVIAVYT